MAIRNIVRFICFALIFSLIPFPAAADENRWWPVQAMPKGLVRLQKDLPAPRASCDMMAQSVAGLAAKAVNEGRADEMVWVGTVTLIYRRKTQRHRAARAAIHPSPGASSGSRPASAPLLPKNWSGASE
jgi:hypothetical protein